MFSPLMVLTWCFSIFVLVCFFFFNVLYVMWKVRGDIELEEENCSDRDV